MRNRFDEVFKKEQKGISPLLINKLNNNLPEGLKYEKVDKNLFALIPKDKLNIKNYKYVLPSKFKELYPDNQSISDLYLFSYNAQLPIELKKGEDGELFIDGIKIDQNDLVKQIDNGKINQVGGMFEITPPKFPDPFTLKVGNESHSVEFLIQRQPKFSLEEIEFKSINKKNIECRYTINMKENTIIFIINIRPYQCQSIDEAIAYTSIKNSVNDRTLLINDLRLFEPSIISNTQYNYFSILKEVQKQLDVIFSFPLEQDEHSKLTSLQIYNSLIGKKSFFKGDFLSHFECNVHANELIEETDCNLWGSEEIEVSLYGVRKSLYMLKC